MATNLRCHCEEYIAQAMYDEAILEFFDGDCFAALAMTDECVRKSC